MLEAWLEVIFTSLRGAGRGRLDVDLDSAQSVIGGGRGRARQVKNWLPAPLAGFCNLTYEQATGGVCAVFWLMVDGDVGVS